MVVTSRNHTFFGKNDEKRALLSSIIFRALLYLLKKVEILVILLKTELQFDIHRSSSIVVKTIKKMALLRCSKNR